MTIYGDTLTVPKPVYGIDFEKELLTLALRSTKFTHPNKLLPHTEHIHISPTQIFHKANTPKIQTKIYPTTS